MIDKKSFLKGLLSRIFRNFEKLSVRAFDFVIAATEAIKRKFLRKISRVETVKNYISLEYVRKGSVDKSKSDSRGLQLCVCVNPVDCRSIAMAIEYLCENPDLRKQMGLNGKKAIVGEFNWERESDKLVNIYRKLCGGKNV